MGGISRRNFVKGAASGLLLSMISGKSLAMRALQEELRRALVLAPGLEPLGGVAEQRLEEPALPGVRGVG